MADAATEPDAATDGPDAATEDAGAPPFFPCTTATPVSSGLERCDPSGYLRRVGPATCPRRTLMFEPRANFPEMDQCHSDSECEDLPNGFCGKREGGNALECIAGCETDADCDEGRVCFCGVNNGEPAGRCVPASCESSDDCEPGYECIANEAKPGCPSTRFECQTPQDGCGFDGDCAGFIPNPSFCVWKGESFECDITQWTQP